MINRGIEERYANNRGIEEKYANNRGIEERYANNREHTENMNICNKMSEVLVGFSTLLISGN